ncbi:ImmA/IrrE family metallo-endopeptidase [Acetobacterium tundrae]|uniref:ImmA/IrrE family metallo-endopeptidase n=1 Tax=Acetobacterium tundrae TaxID=132932 RepID=A0ABR6WPN6_9FIRM|nr:ImmA/IrrE family metallo-endopeptidase [Acetobacterium tundrae]MBC3798459.1 ImmA/IrrE family metallo-endopeptidase [Acetobacterium tundrae]
MYELELKKSEMILKRYKISSFPIQLWELEQFIIDRGYDIIISKEINTSSTLGHTVYIPVARDPYSRVFLSHELGHILCHCFNTYKKCDLNISKCERQANAFADFLLMPFGVFEKDLRYLDEWRLSEKYGVPVEQIQTRYCLCREYQYH